MNAPLAPSPRTPTRRPFWLWRYPLHALAAFGYATGCRFWASGVLLHFGGKRGVLIALVRREDRPSPEHQKEPV